MTKHDKIRERVRLLLNKAESTTHQEAQALTEAAMALILRYAITEADLDSTDATDQIVTRSYVINGPYAEHLIAGITELARALNVMCMMVAAYGDEPHLLHGRQTRGHSIRLIGHSREIADAVTLVRSVVTQALAFTPRWAAAILHKRGITVTAKDRRSFLVGYLYAAARRVNDNRNQIIEEKGTGTELAILNRWTQVEQWAADQYNVQTIDFAGHLNGAANEGARHGRDANVGETELTMDAARPRVGVVVTHSQMRRDGSQPSTQQMGGSDSGNGL